MEWRFDDNEVWGLEDLTDAEREYAIDHGCEEGKKYFGGEFYNNEVPQCPFCDTIVWDKTRCSHLLFIYDWTNGEYPEMDESFYQYFYLVWLPENQDSFTDELSDLPEDDFGKIKMPPPDILMELFDELDTYEIYHAFGIGGTIWGFGSPELISLIGK